MTRDSFSMHVALLANLKKNAPTWPGMSPDQWDDLDSPSTIEGITAALESGGHKVTFLEGDATLLNHLLKVKPDICFNICESHFGDAREAQVPALLEMLRIPYTGSRVLALALALDKPMTKRVLTYHELPTPLFQVFERPNEELDPEMKFPLFMKPSREGTGMGVSAESIIYNKEQLYSQLEKMLVRYQQPILVEHYVEGREVTIGMVGNLTGPVARRIPDDEMARRIFRGLHLFPALEIDTAAYPQEEAGLYTNRIKTELAEEIHVQCPAVLPDELLADLNWYAAATFRVMGCLDVARVDFRLDKHDNNKPYILEINPLPGLNPGYSDLCLEATADGWSYEQLINRILDLAIERYQLAK